MLYLFLYTITLFNSKMANHEHPRPGPEGEYSTTFHGSSSCAMGKVVDTQLRVKGIDNLRVVDASVFPISFGSHIQAAVYALAEQAAVLIAQAAEGGEAA